ncbi:unnamed protein product [Heligmosomoides polygyrus]|uniref:Gag-pol polyprotein n=1 Tax=Heligmosomoides polygyrus TaxID=6339 RepID=A0A183GM44_HELPZ|nr:unnamed protein product [Heligmosomoides polygyrus]
MRIRNNEYIDFDAHHVINFVGVTYHHSKKDIPKTFYVEVFNMIAVALTNFRRNLKNQALKEEYLSEQRAESGTQTANEEPPDRASTTSPAAMYDVPGPSQSSAFTTLSFFDYSQE